MRNIHLAKLVQALIRCEHGESTTVSNTLSEKYDIGGRLAQRLTEGSLKTKDSVHEIVTKLTALLIKHHALELFSAIITGKSFNIETYTEKIDALNKQYINSSSLDATTQNLAPQKTRVLFTKKNEIPYIRDWIDHQGYAGINKDICEYILMNDSLDPRNFRHMSMTDKKELPNIVKTINKSTKRDEKTYGENNEIKGFRISLVKLPGSKFNNQYVFSKVIPLRQ